MHRPNRRTLLTTLILALIVGLAAPAGSQSLSEARRAQDQAKRQKAAAAAQLDVLKANDRQVEAALADLQAAYRAADAKAVAARQAAQAADAELAAARQRLADTQAEIEHLEELVVDRAIAAYVRPQHDYFDQMMSSRDIGEIAHRQVLLEQVAAHDADVLDQLGAAKEDLQIAEAAADAAAEKAAARKAEADALLGEAQAARDEQARVAAALDARISEYRAEVDRLAAHESSLTALIRRKEAEAARANVVPGSPGAPGASGLIWPVRGRVTSEYGYRWGRRHQGIDIGAPTGTPIWAAQSGVVIYSGWMNGYGNVVVIDHGGGFTTVYAHQSRIASGDGQRVGRGDTIGYVGSTGRSTGPHLHFETRVNGQAQNPRRYL